MELRFPTPLKKPLTLTARMGTPFWADALTKEMGNVCVAFEILGPNDKPPFGWYKASGHIAFDVKMDFTRKARWVKDRHKTPDSTTPSFAGVVSWEGVCVILTYAALLGFPVVGADIWDAYLQAPCSEKHYTICGPKFGIENEGCVGIIWRALYGGKVAVWHHLHDCMGHLGFSSSEEIRSWNVSFDWAGRVLRVSYLSWVRNIWQLFGDAHLPSTTRILPSHVPWHITVALGNNRQP